MALIYTRTTGETVLLMGRGCKIAKPPSDQDKSEDTLLHHLATKGNSNLVTLLLQHPHDIGIQDEKDESSLLCAVQAGNEEVVDQLLEAGAELKMRPVNYTS